MMIVMSDAFTKNVSQPQPQSQRALSNTVISDTPSYDITCECHSDNSRGITYDHNLFIAQTTGFINITLTAGCHHTDCHYPECCGAKLRPSKGFIVQASSVQQPKHLCMVKLYTGQDLGRVFNSRRCCMLAVHLPSNALQYGLTQS